MLHRNDLKQFSVLIKCRKLQSSKKNSKTKCNVLHKKQKWSKHNSTEMYLADLRVYRIGTKLRWTAKLALVIQFNSIQVYLCGVKSQHKSPQAASYCKGETLHCSRKKPDNQSFTASTLWQCEGKTPFWQEEIFFITRFREGQPSAMTRGGYGKERKQCIGR